MQIEFSQEELEALARMAYMAEWMANSYRLGEEDPLIVAVMSKIFKEAADQGHADWVESYLKLDTLPSRTFENLMAGEGWIEDYNDDVFWKQLADRLAIRAIINRIGEKAYEALGPEEQRELILQENAEIHDKDLIAGFLPGIEKFEYKKYHSHKTDGVSEGEN